MKILLIADKVSPVLYSENIKRNPRLRNIDCILSAGDLPFYYYDFLVSNLNAPLYYILGNHIRDIDEEFERELPVFRKMGGFFNLDNKVIRYHGLLMAGLEGSFRYNDKNHQYTESQMRFKIFRLIPRMLKNKLLYGRYLDILLTHAPPYGIYAITENDTAHRGFEAFNRFIRRFKPRYVIHGHVHLLNEYIKSVKRYRNTKIVNAYGYKILNIRMKKKKV
ncbi:MAG: metallophosphoesterase [bacterium]|nr:metallophosphoesterase [bacterium]